MYTAHNPNARNLQRGCTHAEARQRTFAFYVVLIAAFLHNEGRAMDYVIRPLTEADEQLLWEMLYQGLQTTEGETAPSPDIVRTPELARYVEGWGRGGDTGFVAHDAQEGKPLGAVWVRLPAGETKKEGDATAVTPELAFAVKRGHRRHGIGAALLTQFVKANPQQSSISMSVAPNNPAVRLYERFGFKVVSESADAVTMRRDI